MPVRHATIDEIHTLVEAFAALSWPAAREQMTGIARELEWTVRLERDKGIDFATAFSFGRTPASVLLDDGAIAQVTVQVSTRIEESDADERAELALAYEDVCSMLVGLLHDPARTRRGSLPKTSWDLGNGGRIAVARLSRVVTIDVIQQRYADIERFEESRGITGDRDPLADSDA